MESKPDKLSGQKLLIYILETVIKRTCNCELLRQNLVDRQRTYPFFTFNWITLDEEQSFEWLGNNRQYYTEMQIDIHSNDYLEAIDLIKQLFVTLKSSNYRMCFRQVGVVPSVISSIEDRTFSPDVNYDYSFGFDCKFVINGNEEYRLSDLQFNYEDTTINSIGLNRNNASRNDIININKTEE